MKTETLSFAAAKGATSAFVAMPDTQTGKTKAVILIQEWWGLNDHIKDIAGRYAAEGFIAVAPDLYRGMLAANAEEAGEMMADLAVEDGLDIIKQAMASASSAYKIESFGITGFCMGGTYALRAACELEGISASAPFYGDIPPQEILENLNVPVLFVSALKDGWINPEKVAELERATEKFGLSVEQLKYDADHAFFNNTRPEVYDDESAKDAWAKVVEFFHRTLI